MSLPAAAAGTVHGERRRDSVFAIVAPIVIGRATRERP